MARVASFAPERSEGANDAMRDTNNPYARQKSCDYHYYITRSNRTNSLLSRRLIISTEQTDIYISTFPNALTSKKAQNYDISVYFSTNSIVLLCHAP